MRQTLAFLALVALALAALPARAAGDDLQMLSVNDVEKMVGAPDVRIFDANTPEIYAKSHVPGAVFVDSDTLASRLPQDKTTRLVFYCKNPH
jgi:rhodanese-related sulfurtransferase